MTPPESAAVESARVLREQKLYLESLLEISPTAIVTLGLNRKVTSWNLAAEELFGYTAAEAIGRNLEDLVANEEDLRAEYTAYFEELARGEDAAAGVEDPAVSASMQSPAGRGRTARLST